MVLVRRELKRLDAMLQLRVLMLFSDTAIDLNARDWYFGGLFLEFFPSPFIVLMKSATPDSTFGWYSTLALADKTSICDILFNSAFHIRKKAFITDVDPIFSLKFFIKIFNRTDRKFRNAVMFVRRRMDLPMISWKFFSPFLEFPVLL